VQIATTLKARMGDAARRVPKTELPDWLLRMVALFNPEVRQILPELGKPKNATSAKAKRVLGWNPRSNVASLTATAESLVRLGMLKDQAGKA